MTERTSIHLKTTTLKRLKKHLFPSEPYDDLIDDLISFAEDSDWRQWRLNQLSDYYREED